MSNHYLVEAIIRLEGYSSKRSQMMEDKRVIKVSELEKAEVREAFKQLLAEEWERVSNTRLLSVEEEWMLFKETVLRIAAEVCGYRKVGRKNKRSAWWDQEM